MQDILSSLVLILVLSTFSNIYVASRKRCGVSGTTKGSASVGTSFYTGFMRNYDATFGIPTLLITSQSANVYITAPFLAKFDEHHVVNGSKVITFPKDLKVDADQTITNKAVRITSDFPISVYSINNEVLGSSDGGAVYPEESLGTDYIIAGAPVLPPASDVFEHFLIIGTEDDTQITVEFPVAGPPLNILINRMETYYYVTLNFRISGTIITATKPIVVKSGHSCFFIDTVCDLLSEQMPPIPTLGRVHVTGYMKPRANYFLQVLSPLDQTDVYVYNSNGLQLDAFIGMSRGSGNVIFYSEAAVSVIATQPVLVVQYGDDYAGEYADASLMQVMSTDRFGSAYDFTVETLDYYSTLMIAISNNFDNTGLLLNGVPLVVTESVSVNVPNNGQFEIIYADVASNATHTLSHTDGSNVKFGAWLFGRATSVAAEYAWPLLSFF